MKTLGFSFLFVVLLIILLPFISPSVDHFERRMYVTYRCHNSGPRVCEGLFHRYEATEDTLDLARVAGRIACSSGRAASCVSYGRVLEKGQYWPEATLAYEEACKLGDTAACSDQLILLTGAGRLKEAFESARALCEKNVLGAPGNPALPPTDFCFLAGVIARQTNEKSSEEWAFYKGCYTDQNADSCVALGMSYLAQKNRKLGVAAMKTGCDIGLRVACENYKMITKLSSEPVKESVETISQDQRRWRAELASLISNATGKKLADLSFHLGQIRAAVLSLENRYQKLNVSADKQQAQVRDLYLAEVNLEIDAVTKLETAVQSKKGIASKTVIANGAAQMNRVREAQNLADAAFSRLPASK